MSRNSSGTYSLPAGNPVVSGTTISSSTQNSTLSDVAAEITNSLDRNGRGAMLAPIVLPNGSNSAPAVAFTAEVNTGLYRAGSNDARVAIAGSDAVKVTSSGVTVSNALTVNGASSVGGNGSITGNATVGGTLGVTGATTLSGDATVNSKLAFQTSPVVSTPYQNQLTAGHFPKVVCNASWGFPGTLQGVNVSGISFTAGVLTIAFAQSMSSIWIVQGFLWNSTPFPPQLFPLVEYLPGRTSSQVVMYPMNGFGASTDFVPPSGYVVQVAIWGAQ